MLIHDFFILFLSGIICSQLSVTTSTNIIALRGELFFPVFGCCLLYGSNFYKREQQGIFKPAIIHIDIFIALALIQALGVTVLNKSPILALTVISTAVSSTILLIALFGIGYLTRKLTIACMNIYKFPDHALLLVPITAANTANQFILDNKSIFIPKIIHKIPEIHDDLSPEESEQIIKLLVEKNISRIFFIDLTSQQSFNQLKAAAKLLGIPCTQINSSNQENPIIEIYNTHSIWHLAIKQIIDTILSIFFLIITSPLFVVIAILVRKSSHGSAFFRQRREGTFGEHFEIIKFRTMLHNSDHPPENIENNHDIISKTHNHKYVTPLGHFLRKSSLDELPQLLNVLKGDMSLIGPRPLLLHESKKLTDLNFRRRYSFKPGISGLWQVSGRSNIKSFCERLNLDTRYIDNWSLFTDLKIALRTIIAVLTGRGAH